MMAASSPRAASASRFFASRSPRVTSPASSARSRLRQLPFPGRFHLRHDGQRRRQDAVQRVDVVPGQIAERIATRPVGLVGVFQAPDVFIIHEQLEPLHRRLPHRIRHRVRDAALLDPDVHQFAGVFGQRQVARRLHDQQQHRQQHGGFRVFQLAQNGEHVLLPSFLSVCRFPFIP